MDTMLVGETRLNAIAPVFTVPDVERTASWYAEVLGFDVDPFPDDEPYLFATLRLGDVRIMLQRRPVACPPAGTGAWSAYISVSGIRELYERLEDLPELREPLHRQPYGDWEFEVVDPNGYVLVLSELGR